MLKCANLVHWKIVPGELHGVMSEYHLATTTINGQLASLYAKGYTRLSLNCCYWHGVSDGFTMDPTGGTFPPQQMQNLAAICAEAKAIGFTRLVLNLCPEGPDDALNNWTTWNEPYYEESWILINNLRNVLVQSGLPYLIDLANEGVAAASDNPQWRAYAKRLWMDYTSMFGSGPTKSATDATISCNPLGVTSADVADVFQGNLPPEFRAACYGNEGFPCAYVEAQAIASIAPQGVPLAVKEALDDYTSQREIQQALPNLVELGVWPLTANLTLEVLQ